MAIADPDQFLIDWQRLVQNQIDAMIDQQRQALHHDSPTRCRALSSAAPHATERASGRRFQSIFDFLWR